MSKPVKALIRRELVDRLQGVTSLAVVGFAGVDAVTNNRIRGRLRGKEIRMMVVKNSLARQAFKEVGLGDACALLDGPCALAYGAETIVDTVRALAEWARQVPAFQLKGVYLEGRLLEGAAAAAVAGWPNRAETLAHLAGCALGPGAGLAAQLTAPAAAILGALRARVEKLGGEEAAPTPAAG